MTAGDGGYGFSLVLSLMTRRPGPGCSPGTYGATARTAGRSQSAAPARLLHRLDLAGRLQLRRVRGRRSRGGLASEMPLDDLDRVSLAAGDPGEHVEQPRPPP